MLHLGERLRSARKLRRLSQQVAADKLGLSRTAISNIEKEIRKISTLELTRMAELYGQSASYLLGEVNGEAEQDIFVLLRETLPRIADQREVEEAIWQIVDLLKEGANLKKFLGMEGHRSAPDYEYKLTKSADAVRQGQRVALEERRRLGLGDTPIANIAELITEQGIWTAATKLPEGVSGMFLNHSTFGSAILANAEQDLLQRRFSYAHEYAHALFDRHSEVHATSDKNASELVEKRANAFASTFLMPPSAVAEQLEQMNKGRPSRYTELIFDAANDSAVKVNERHQPSSQAITFQNVATMARHFIVSYEAAMWRLKNLGHINQLQLQRLFEQSSFGNDYIDLLSLDGDNSLTQKAPVEIELRYQLVPLCLEAYRRGEISPGRVREIAMKLDLDAAKMLELARAILDE